MSAGKFEPLRSVRPVKRVDPNLVILAILAVTLLYTLCFAAILIMLGLHPTGGIGSW